MTKLKVMIGEPGSRAERVPSKLLANFQLFRALINPGADDPDLFGGERLRGRTAGPFGGAWSLRSAGIGLRRRAAWTTAGCCTGCGRTGATGCARTAGAPLGRHCRFGINLRG